MFICDSVDGGQGGTIRPHMGGAPGVAQRGDGGAGQTLVRMMEMIRLQGEQLQLLAPVHVV